MATLLLPGNKWNFLTVGWMDLLQLCFCYTMNDYAGARHYLEASSVQRDCGVLRDNELAFCEHICGYCSNNVAKSKGDLGTITPFFFLDSSSYVV